MSLLDTITNSRADGDETFRKLEAMDSGTYLDEIHAEETTAPPMEAHPAPTGEPKLPLLLEGEPEHLLASGVVTERPADAYVRDHQPIAAASLHIEGEPARGTDTPVTEEAVAPEAAERQEGRPDQVWWNGGGRESLKAPHRPSVIADKWDDALLDPYYAAGNASAAVSLLAERRRNRERTIILLGGETAAERRAKQRERCRVDLIAGVTAYAMTGNDSLAREIDTAHAAPADRDATVEPLTVTPIKKDETGLDWFVRNGLSPEDWYGHEDEMFQRFAGDLHRSSATGDVRLNHEGMVSGPFQAYVLGLRKGGSA